MTPGAVTKYLKPFFEEGTERKLYYAASTAVKSFYFSRMDDVEFDDENEVMSWTDNQDLCRYHFDYADINMVVELTPENQVYNAVY
jgi:hypothetical protein